MITLEKPKSLLFTIWLIPPANDNGSTIFLWNFTHIYIQYVANVNFSLNQCFLVSFYIITLFDFHCAFVSSFFLFFLFFCFGSYYGPVCYFYIHDTWSSMIKLSEALCIAVHTSRCLLFHLCVCVCCVCVYVIGCWRAEMLSSLSHPQET